MYDKISESSGLSKVKMDIYIKDFLDKLSRDNLRIVKFPEIVLLCGGPACISNDEVKSFRDVLLKNDLSTKYLLPEEIKEWNQGNLYSDLLTFEEDLAMIISAVVLFVESAGAIAELGAFSKIVSINNKLLVIMDTTNYNQSSFITLGPVKYLENLNKGSILTCKFLRRNICCIENCQSECDNVKNEINSFVKEIKTKNLDFNLTAHIALFICEILSYFQILSFSEIKEIMDCICPKAKSVIQRSIFLLESLDLIKSEHYMRSNYYFPTNCGQTVRFSFNDKYIDKVTFAKNYLEYLKKQKDNIKCKAYFAHLR